VNPVAFASIGECMIELSGGDGDLWKMGFAGDTFNTAFYARAILPPEERVAYVTALGEDPFSKRMIDFFARAGIETSRIRTIPGRRPGLYAITLSGAERAFTYWRGESAARQLADHPGWLMKVFADVDMLYFSGITLAILRPDRREQLLLALSDRRDRGARIAFDPNWRPALWPDRGEARAAMEEACRIADLALPTFSDEAELFGDGSPEDTARRIGGWGVEEIVVKNGEEPCLVVAEGTREAVPAVRPEQVVDTTGAGDSFGGAYLAARLMGVAPAAAARLGHQVAAKVIGVHGALAEVDREAAMRAAEVDA
jgi:2-dehydro-3-deoxygluconokinase